MPVLYLTEDEVRSVLTMEMAMEAVELVLRKMALEEAFNVPRTRCQTDHTMLHVLSAAAKSLGVMGYKAYTTNRKGNRFHVTIYDGKTGEMQALMQADWLGQIRTGAASAVATKYLARPDSSKVGLYGSGKQARTQLLGVCKVRPIKQVHIYSPNEERRKAFAQEMTKWCQTDVIAVDDPMLVAKDKDIVITATTNRDPVLKGEWLAPGTHLNIIGSNFLGKTEIDVEVVRRSNLIVIDSKEQGNIEAGDFIMALSQHILGWPDVMELGRVITGRSPTRSSPEQITLFKSLGIGLEDIAVASKVMTKAKEQGIGKMLDL